MDMGTCLTAEAEELKPNYILYQPIILDLLVSYISVGLIHIQTSLITALEPTSPQMEGTLEAHL